MNAAVKAGLAPAQIMELATIFGWDIDFALDLRQGDSFALVFDDEYADGEYLQSGDILAAEFINQESVLLQCDTKMANTTQKMAAVCAKPF